MAFAPWEFQLESAYSSQYDYSQIGFSIQRAVPIESLLPQVTADSYLKALTVSVATRFVDQEYDQFRFRIRAADIQLQRAFTSGGVRLLDFDQTSEIDRTITWLEAIFGPGFHVDGPSNSVWGRITASGAFSSQKTGSFLYQDPSRLLLLDGNYATNNTNGLNYAFNAVLGAKLANRVTLSGRLFTEEVPHATYQHRGWMVGIAVQASPKWKLTTNFADQTFDFDTLDHQFGTLEFNIQYNPSGIR